METNKKILKQAYDDYIELVSIVKDYDGTLEELCNKLYGHNFEEDSKEKLFDLNYKSITTTIYDTDNNLWVSKHVDVWDDENHIMIEECLDIDKLLKKIEVA